MDNVSHAQIRQNMALSIRDAYLAEHLTDEQVIDGLPQAAAFAAWCGISATDYLRIVISALKLAGNRKLAARVHDDIYMPAIMEGD